MENIVQATYVSVWDGGIEVRNKCNYNPVIFDVTDIEESDVQGLHILDREYLELKDGTIIERKDFTIDGDCDED